MYQTKQLKYLGQVVKSNAVWDAWRTHQTCAMEHLVCTCNSEPVHSELVQNNS